MSHSYLKYASKDQIDSTITLLEDSLEDSFPRTYFINQCSQSQYALVYDYIEPNEYVTGLSQEDAFVFFLIILEAFNN
jgi:hypothetical protein